MRDFIGLLTKWVPVLFWASLIFAVSADSNPYRAFPDSHQESVVTLSNPGDPKPQFSPLRPGFEALGRAAHAFEFAVLGFLLVRALILHVPGSFHTPIRNLKGMILGDLHEDNGRGLIRFLFLAFLLSFAFGFSDELHQSLVAGRAFQTVDLILDALGSMAGVLVFIRFAPFYRRLTASPAK